MDSFSSNISPKYVVVTITIYFLTVIFYRLFFHPLAKFPGPKLAAVTRYVEAYYDVVCNGQYTFKIAEMHRKYGPIVRISPYELHINDPSFYEKLYSRDGRWDKYSWSYNAFGGPLATLFTIDNDVHRHRRAALSPFFSKANVAAKQDFIHRSAAKLCYRLEQIADSNVGQASVGSAISAFTQDVVTEFALGKCFNNLDKPDFNADLATTLKNSGSLWRITKHIRWYGPLMKSLPMSFVEKVASDGAKTFLAFIKDMTSISSEIHSASANGTLDPDAPRTMVHEILDSSDLPPAEKSFERILAEVGSVTGAAFQTTPNSIRLTLYHIYSDPAVLRRLRTELAAAAAAAGSRQEKNGPESGPGRLAELERLPYLTAVLTEGLRLGPATATRAARVAPDRDLRYGGWRIPAGTPVGMTTILMHHDPELYPDPGRFDPERWVGADARKRAEKTYAPFSRGRRVCLGMYLAWAQLYVAVAALVPRFDLIFDASALDDVKWTSDQFIIGTSGNNGLKATVKKVDGSV
ncbi:hypothetical protein Hte_002932 [Hypoxylon texense]